MIDKIDKIDIIVGVVIITIIIIIVAINFKTLINDKISSIAINVPEFPKQQDIIVNIQNPQCSTNTEHFTTDQDKKQITIVIPTKPDTIEKSTPKHVAYPDETIDYDNYDKEHDDYIFEQKNNTIYTRNVIAKSNDNITHKIMLYDNGDREENYDTLNYWIKNRLFIPTSFEDGVTRGGNILDTQHYSTLQDIGKIHLDKPTYKYPKPTNYIFEANKK